MNWPWYILLCWAAAVLERGLAPCLTGGGLWPGSGPLLLMYPAALAMALPTRNLGACAAAAIAGLLVDLGPQGGLPGAWAAGFALAALACRTLTGGRRLPPTGAFLAGLACLLLLGHLTVLGLLLARGIRLPALGADPRPALRPLLSAHLFSAVATLAAGLLLAWPLARLCLPLLHDAPAKKSRGVEYKTAIKEG